MKGLNSSKRKDKKVQHIYKKRGDAAKKRIHATSSILSKGYYSIPEAGPPRIPERRDDSLNIKRRRTQSSSGKKVKVPSMVKTKTGDKYHVLEDGRLLSTPKPTPSSAVHKRIPIQYFKDQLKHKSMIANLDPIEKLQQDRLTSPQKYVLARFLDKIGQKNVNIANKRLKQSRRVIARHRKRIDDYNTKKKLLGQLYGIKRDEHMYKSLMDVQKEHALRQQEQMRSRLAKVMQQERAMTQLIQNEKAEFLSFLRGVSRSKDASVPYTKTLYNNTIASTPTSYFHDKVLSQYSSVRQKKQPARFVFLEDIPKHMLKASNIEVMRNWLRSASKPKPLSALATTPFEDINIPAMANSRYSSAMQRALSFFNPSSLKPKIVVVNNPIFRRTMVAFQQSNAAESSALKPLAGTASTEDGKDGGDGQPTTPKKKKATIKEMYKKYGKLVVAVYFGVYFATLAGIFATFLAIPGLDPNEMINKVKGTGFLSGPKLDYLENFVKEKPSLTTFFAAWCTTKLTEPVRAMVTLFLTKYIADRREARKKQGETPPSSSSSSSDSTPTSAPPSSSSSDSTPTSAPPSEPVPPATETR